MVNANVIGAAVKAIQSKAATKGHYTADAAFRALVAVGADKYTAACNARTVAKLANQ